MAKLHQRAAGTENHQGFLHRFCQNNGLQTSRGIEKNRIKTPDLSGKKPGFANKPPFGVSQNHIKVLHHEATNVPPIWIAVFILFIALWGNVSSDT